MVLACYCTVLSNYFVILHYFAGSSPVCFSSYKNPVLKSLVHPIPLVVLCKSHPKCKYNWHCLNRPDLEFQSTPVLFVYDPLVFKCDVYIGDSSVVSVNFDVLHQPATGKF